MSKMLSLEQKGRLLEGLRFVLEMHNRLRSLLPEPDELPSHFVNENTVVRVAATLEQNGIEAAWKPPTTDWGRVCINTTFFMRNCAVHAAAGRLDPTRIDCYKCRVEFYKQFCSRIEEARVKEGERLCLAGLEVLTPLIEGCIQFVESIGAPGDSQA